MTIFAVYLLTSSGVAAEVNGGRLGLYYEIKAEDYNGRVFKQKDGDAFIYKKNGYLWIFMVLFL